MNYYETLYIVHPALEAGRLKDLIMGVEDSLKKMGGDLISIELWGKRRLAYFIDKQKYGTYVLIQYNGEGKLIFSDGGIYKGIFKNNKFIKGKHIMDTGTIIMYRHI